MQTGCDDTQTELSYSMESGSEAIQSFMHFLFELLGRCGPSGHVQPLNAQTVLAPSGPFLDLLPQSRPDNTVHIFQYSRKGL